MLIINKEFEKTGKILINNFIKEFQDEFKDFILNYARNSIEMDHELEHIFFLGEQQVKTAVTYALYKPCNGYFMQEPPVSRRPADIEKARNKDYSNGRVDYWCCFGQKTKLSILLEVKHSWINYKKESVECTLYSDTKKQHEKAISQIKNIKKDDYNTGNLYGTALTVLPIFTRYKSLDDTVLELDEKRINELGNNVLCQDNIFDACGGIVFPKELQTIISFDDESSSKKTRYQSFPGIFLLWSLFKFTKK